MSEQTGHFDDPPDDATLAGEYVLGLLAQSERAGVEARIAADPAFARLVESWAIRLQPLAEGLAPVEPPARIWTALESRIAGRARQGRMRTGLWGSLAFWRWTTGLASAAALAGFILLNGALEDGARKDALVAALQAPNAGPMLMAHLDMATHRLVVHASGMQLPADTVVELWVIPADGQPRSLGLIAAAQSSDMPMPGPAMPYLVADAMLAVSIEPMGGSPTGLPTGPVVASGKLQKI